MEFTPAERRFLHRSHPELRMPALLTVEDFIAINCKPADAEIIVARELERRALRLGKKFSEARSYLNNAKNSLEDTDPLMDKVKGAGLF